MFAAMATRQPVNRSANYCRDCGGPTTHVAGQNTCLNLSPKVACENLTLAQRRYCEHDAFPDPGPGICPGCHLPPTPP